MVSTNKTPSPNLSPKGERNKIPERNTTRAPLPREGERLGEGEQKNAATTRARELRRDGSRAERFCWELLRDRRMGGAKFRRQYPIGPFFADFACIKRKLVVEIDGDHRAFQVDADTRRTAAMGRSGWRVLRFWASEVVANREGVAAAIARALSTPPHPTSPPRGGEEPDSDSPLHVPAPKELQQPDLEEMPSHVPPPLEGKESDTEEMPSHVPLPLGGEVG